MSATIDLEGDYLACKSKAEAESAAGRINGDEWMRWHLRVSPSCDAHPPRDDAWRLAVADYDGCGWREDRARGVWLAIAPHMADDAELEFREEGGGRFRVRWSQGRVFEEFPKQVIWALECEITPALLKEATS